MVGGRCTRRSGIWRRGSWCTRRSGTWWRRGRCTQRSGAWGRGGRCTRRSGTWRRGDKCTQRSGTWRMRAAPSQEESRESKPSIRPRSGSDECRSFLLNISPSRNRGRLRNLRSLHQRGLVYSPRKKNSNWLLGAWYEHDMVRIYRMFKDVCRTLIPPLIMHPL